RVQEMVRAGVEDLEPIGTGYRLRLVGAKTARGRRSQFVLLTATGGPLDPVAGLDEWLAVRGDHDGPLFCSVHHGRRGGEAGAALSDNEISAVIGDLAVAAGLPPTVSGYSLRRSWATHAYLRDPADLTAISLHLRHTSVDMTVRYIDDLGLHLLDASDYLSRDAVRASGPARVARPKDLGFDEASLEDLGREVRLLTEETRPRAKSTKLADDSMWNGWLQWAEGHSLDPVPASPESLVLFAAARAVDGISASTLRAQLRTIRQRHEDQGFDASDLTTMADEIATGLARSAPRERTKAPVLSFGEMLDLAAVASQQAEASGSLEARRDLLMVTVGYAGALRVDDLHRARVELIEELPYGLALRFATSKENPLGTANESVLLLGRDDILDPVAALTAWVDATGFSSGPLIPVLSDGPAVPLSKDSIPDRLRALATEAGITTRPTGHTLRRSWATHAYAAGVDPVTLSRHLRHRDLTTTLGYVQALSPWRDNAAAMLMANSPDRDC
ncbi:MAG TPA: tyrosine-type recombinase/integrase, partial [Acidimicrobiales bacterium]|nr:tyrosine-type recombinase/integrase [Acidimicrobiales bacterium]